MWKVDQTAVVTAEQKHTATQKALADAVNAERARRIVAGTIVDGVHVTGSDDDARNLSSLALAAQLRLAAGDRDTITTFRDGDNVDHELTPAHILSLWQQSASYVSTLYAASWALKAMNPIPVDFADDKYWHDLPLDSSSVG